MRTKILFKGFESQPYHEDFAQMEALRSVGKFEANKEFSIDITIRCEKGRNSGSFHNLFRCDVRFLGGRLPKEFFVHKSSENYEEAVRMAMGAVEKIIRRQSRSRSSKRRLHRLQYIAA